jgi:anti-sigma regulatory factor (Ser/Thr protein kinase)
LKLPAEPSVLSGIRHTMRRWLVAHGANEDELAEMTMAISEACANAIEHAYAPGPRTFELEALTSGGVATVTVRDSGQWRDPRGQHRGRGLGIINAAMHDVDIARNPDGTVITMRRRLGANEPG